MDDALADLTQKRLAKVLLEFGKAPGKYPVRLGEPRELHAQLDTVTVWALGRLPEELEPQAEQLREAAVMFIARACFAPDGTHYQMFGLTPAACTPEALRARYRNLIRLTHPDMGIKGLPNNAAGIVNRAQGVLNDPDSRRRYDEELAERKSLTRERPAQAQNVRHIEHRIGLAERWQSLKARFSRQLRVGALFGGLAVLVSAFLAWALTGQHDEPMLIAARDNNAETPASTNREISAAKVKPRPVAKRPSEETGETALRVASIEPGATPATAAATTPAPNPGPKEATPAAPMPVAALPKPAPPVAPPAPALVQAAKTAPIAPTAPVARVAQPTTPAPQHDQAAANNPPTLVLDSSARMKPPENTSVVPPDAERGRAAPAPAPVPVPVPVPDQTRQTPRVVASTVAAEPQLAVAKPAPSPPPPQPSVAFAEIRRPVAQPPAPAPAPPAATPAAPSTRTAAAAPPPAATTQAWGIDKPKALQYLSELFGALEHPNKARNTNAYLNEMKVKGSLFQPALQIMQEYPEVDVARVDWTDTGTPGVLRIRGNLMLQGKSPNIPAVRYANFRFTAEFWGTATGTVLGELNLKETE